MCRISWHYQHKACVLHCMLVSGMAWCMDSSKDEYPLQINCHNQEKHHGLQRSWLNGTRFVYPKDKMTRVSQSKCCGILYVDGSWKVCCCIWSIILDLIIQYQLLVPTKYNDPTKQKLFDSRFNIHKMKSEVWRDIERCKSHVDINKVCFVLHRWKSLSHSLSNLIRQSYFLTTTCCMATSFSMTRKVNIIPARDDMGSHICAW